MIITDIYQITKNTPHLNKTYKGQCFRFKKKNKQT